MNKIYSTSKELEGNILNVRDIVIFPWGLKYVISYTSLLNEKTDKNDEIFEILGIRDKYKYCQRPYGYSSQEHSKIPNQFPVSQEKDFGALTRLTLALMRRAERMMKKMCKM